MAEEFQSTGEELFWRDVYIFTIMLITVRGIPQNAGRPQAGMLDWLSSAFAQGANPFA